MSEKERERERGGGGAGGYYKDFQLILICIVCPDKKLADQQAKKEQVKYTVLSLRFSCFHTIFFRTSEALLL